MGIRSSRLNAICHWLLFPDALMAALKQTASGSSLAYPGGGIITDVGSPDVIILQFTPTSRLNIFFL